ncbi:hypothetical protein KP509_25G019700 [Ceratopteris richardii]|uniref:Translation initiation factor eIF2B subunit gamma n=2 Tax=Ceratopteris richardii TaxID=49495 RepID=A0A8T2RQT5_CERRI|nr:hypothetical protein KP509_25G019700 [Ceratopteris richardii]
MGQQMNFQVVLLAGGVSKQLFPLVSKELPKALLPLGNKPLLSYTLEQLESSNLKSIIVVVAGEDVAEQIRAWISGAYDDRLSVESVTVAEDAGTADALRAVASRLTAEHILVISGDLVCDIPLGAIAATHCRKKASMTALLCALQVAGTSDGSSGSTGKEKAKQQSSNDVIGLDPSHEFLTFMASAARIDKQLQIQRSIVRAFGRVELHTDLVDDHLYVFKRTILQEVLEGCPGIRSIKEELVPYLIRSQLRSNPTIQSKPLTENGGEQFERKIAPNQLVKSPLEQASLLGAQANNMKCCAYIVNKDRYCARVNSVQSFIDVNQDVAGERAVHLTGYDISRSNNVIHPTSKLGYKSTVGPHCMLGEGSEMGDKCSIKRSVVGRHCRIGSGVKIMNSVVMDHVTIDDGCIVQGSVICNNAHLQERVTLKDCQVGAAYIVSGEHQGEALAKRDKN